MPTSFALLKFHADGSPDERFGEGGLAVLDLGLPRDADVYVGSLAVDSSERLVVGGSIDGRFAVARTLSNGRPDVTFGERGLARFNFFSSSSEIGGHVAVDDADRVYVAGTARRHQREEIALARLDRHGRLDRSFGGDGKVLTRFGPADAVAARAITLDRHQRPVVAGVAHRGDESFVALARYRANGSLDRSFGGDGKVLTDYRSARKEAAFGVAADDAERVVSCGTTGGPTPNVIVTRHRGDGGLDRSFGRDGKVVTEIYASREEHATAVAVDARGRIVVAGYARLLSSRTTDEQGGERIAAVLLARYEPGGTLDTSFDWDGTALVGNPEHYGGRPALALSIGGTVYAGAVWGPPVASPDPQSPVRLGHSRVGIVRCTDVGSLDGRFGRGGSVEFRRPNVALRPNGNGLVALPDGDPVVAFAIDTAA